MQQFIKNENNPLVWYEFGKPKLKFLQGEPQHGRFIRRILVVWPDWAGNFLYGSGCFIMGYQQDSKQISCWKSVIWKLSACYNVRTFCS